MKKRLSLNTQLKSLQDSINALNELIDIAGTPNTQEAKDALSDIKQIIYSLRDIRYRLTGKTYSPMRYSQLVSYSIKEVRNHLISYSKSQALDQFIKSACEQENLRLITVEEYLDLYPDKQNCKEDTEIELANKYIELIAQSGLPAPSQKLLKYICDEIQKQKFQQNDELF